jgi:hypothetical protein
MEAILELLIGLLGYAIYGTSERPRHPLLRNMVRLIAFGGTAIAVAFLFGLTGGFKFFPFVIFVWLLCSLIVIYAEYYLGNPKIAHAAAMAYTLLFAVAMWKLI